MVLCTSLQIFLGPFRWNKNSRQSVDHTAPYHVGYTTIVVPLLLETEIWSIAHPLSDNVWYASIISIPVFLVVMALADFVYFGKIHWTPLLGFVIRNVFSEHNEMPNNKRGYQKILIIVWLASIFVLVQSYAGNLTAMLTAPRLPLPITNSEEFLDQAELSLVVPKKTVLELRFKIAPPNPTMRRLGVRTSVSKPLTRTEFLKYGCYTTKYYNHGKKASICFDASFEALTSYDFSRTGKCNFYTTNDKFLPSLLSIGAFQVGIFLFKHFLPSIVNKFQKGSPYVQDANFLTQLSMEMGLSKERVLEKHLPNATKCSSWIDVRATHRNKDHLVVINYDDIYGILIILAVGLSGSSIIFIIEVVVGEIKKRQK